MTRLPMHVPPAAPAVLVSGSATGGLGVLGALAAIGCAGAVAVLLTGPAPEPTSPISATPVAAVATASRTDPDALPARPGQPLPAAPPLVPAAGVPIGARMPDWRLDLDDAASAVPGLASLPVDPAVERAMADLRVAAAGEPGSRRPGVAAVAALDAAFDQVGDPYVWGAAGPDAFDCSGLTQWSYGAAGVRLPRVSRDQFAAGGEPVTVDDLLPGDLVFFATATWDPGVVHHVGMYAGGGLMVAAPRPGLTVRVEPMTAQGYVGAVRPVPARSPAKQHRGARPDRGGDRPLEPRTEATPRADEATPSPSPSSSASAPATEPAPGPTPSDSAPDPAPTPDPVPSPSTSEPDPTPTATPADGDATLQPSSLPTRGTP